MSASEFHKVMDKNFAKIVQLHNCYVDMSNVTESFKKLLDKEFDINYKIPSNYIFAKDRLVGRTIFQLVASRPDLCQILIDHGADYTITDERGSTVLLREANTEYEQFLICLKLEGEQESKKELCANVILSAHMNSYNRKNPKDKNGLSHFHVACIYNRADAAKFFLENGVPINETVNKDSTFYPGYSALHFAVKSWALETVELLLRCGADVFAKDFKGMNPLHVLIADRKEIFCRLRRMLKMACLNKEKNEYSNLFNYYSKNEQIIYLLLEKMKEFGCYLDNDTGLSYFHILCFLGNMSVTQQFLDDDKVNLSQSVSIDSPIWSGYTPLHFAAHSNVETVELLMKRGANLSMKDAKGVTPFDICLREFTVEDVYKILLQQPDYSNILFSDEKTKLCDFIHAMQDIATFENFFKDNFTDSNLFIPFDSPLCAGYTPLHLAIICTEQSMSWSSKKWDYHYVLPVNLHYKISQKYHSRINSCLSYNAEVTCRDAQGSTPLHLAFRLQQMEAVLKLLEEHAPNCNPIDEHGLSHLHIACAARKETVVQKLLSEGANINEVAIASYTWKKIDTSSHYKDVIREYYINEGSTPLHFAASAQSPNIVEILINNGADVLAKDANGLNPLENIFKLPIFQDAECSKPLRRNFNEPKGAIAKLLLWKVGDQFVDTKPRQMLYCYSLLSEDLFIELLSHSNESVMKILASVGITALHVACITQNLERVNELIDKSNVNATVSLESPLWPGYTPLHLFARDKPGNIFWLDRIKADEAILDKLLQNGADVAATNAKGETPIHQMFPSARYSECVKKLLEYLKDFSANPTNRRGYTHLHVASACGDVSSVEKLLEHGAEIDQPTDYFLESIFLKHHADYTALHLAAAYQRKDVVEVLLKRGADVNRRNAYGGNPLHSAINIHGGQRNFELLQTLIRAGADIHTRDMYGRTSFEVLIKLKNCTKEEVELFLAHGIRVNSVNPMSDEGLLAIALKRNQELPLFEMLVNVPNMRDIDDNEKNAIHNVVSFKRPDWQDIAWKGIKTTFTSSDDYMRGIDALIKLGLNLDHRDCKGSTPLHTATQMQNHTGIVGLLENGADINIVDVDGKPAFAYSLELAELHDETKKLDLHILGIIWMHMYKLNLAGIEISRSNREMYAKIREKISFDISIVDVYNIELERMRKEEINSSPVTLYDFLSDISTISAFPYMLPCIRIAIDSYFKENIESLRKKFPQLTGILLLQYRKALVRGDLIDNATASFNTLVGFEMPVLCSRIIFRFLSNDALNNLINSMNNV